MKRKRLVRIEIFLCILIVIGIFFLIFNVYFILKGFGKDVLYVNNKNRKSINNIVEKSTYYNSLEDFDNVRKIQSFLDFNDLKFTFYYNDGTIKGICDDSLIDLKIYIEEKGYNKGVLFAILEIGMIIICIGLNEKRKKVSKQIDLIDKQEN